MHIDVVPNRGSQPAVLLRESFRQGHRVLKRTLANLSSWPPEKVQALRSLLHDEPLVPAGELFAVERSLAHGHVEVVLGVIRKLGLDSLLAAKRCRVRDLVLALLTQQVLYPCSKLASTRHWHTTTLSQELDVEDADRHEIYAALDWLLKRQPEIERKLAARHLQPGGLALYDVSSSYYYGRHCSLARYGHDRDGKKGLRIITYGLLANAEGRPVAIDVFSGNTADSTTVPAQTGKMRTRFGLARVVLAGDRGMLTETQIRKLREHPEIGWLSALRSPAIRALVEGGALSRSLFDETNLAEIQSADFPGERLIACFNPLLADERVRTREELLRETEKKLAKVAAAVARRRRKPLEAGAIGLRAGKIINSCRVGKHFKLEIGDGRFAFCRDETAIVEEARLDGIYVIRTSEPRERLGAAEAVRGYKSLAHVERLFRCLKSADLRVRPVRVRTEDHVRAHFFLCMLAAYVESHMQEALAPLLFADEEVGAARKTRDPVKPAEPSACARSKRCTQWTADGFAAQSFRSLLQEMATRCRNTCRVKGNRESRLVLVTEATPLQSRVLSLLRL